MVNNNLRKFRESRGFTQDEVAVKLDISRGYYRKLETGKVALDTDYMNALSRIYNCRIEEFIMPLEKTSIYAQGDVYFADRGSKTKHTERYLEPNTDRVNLKLSALASAKIKALVKDTWSDELISETAATIAEKCDGEISDEIVAHHIKLVNKRKGV